MSTKALGSFGEDLARRFLEAKGYVFIRQNFRLPLGEVDLVMKDKETFVLVEVKTKTSDIFGLPQEMVNYKKKRKLILLAHTLMAKYPKAKWRLDVVAVHASNKKIEHFISAIEES